MLPGCTPWPVELGERYRRRGYWEDITLGEMLSRSARAHPDKPALVFADRRITYRELVDTSDRLAAGFRAAGLASRDRVVLHLPNIPEIVFAFLALVRIGAIPVMALPSHRLTEMRHLVKRSKAVGYVIPATIRDFDFRPMADQLCAEFDHLRHVFVAGPANAGQTSLDDTLRSGSAGGRASAPRPDPGDVALMLLSGGTTGLPKLIPRTHNDYVCNCKLSGRVAGMNEHTVFLAVLPIAHNYTLASPGILATLAYGGTVVIAPGRAADVILPLIERESVTHIAAAAPLIVGWLNDPGRGRYDTRSLHVIQNGGARLAPELRRRVRQEFGCLFQEIYGTGEGLLNMTRLDDGEELVLSSSGAPVCDDDEIRVVDDEGRELPDGQSGELICRGPYTIRGYYDDPDADAKAFTADGFYRMGDIARKVGRYVYTEGRKKDVINRGGEKISSEEVENLILAHAKVENVCVVAMPDEVYGERACAFVVPKADQTIGFRELIDFLARQQIAKFKLPERLELVDGFPLSPAGKILRRELRAIIAQKLAAERAQNRETR
ncbi:MAG TPA: AMP-binding protein [Stellaceae bacterium]|nr:AMP-binding protein [Stellaceae bacterium]